VPLHTHQATHPLLSQCGLPSSEFVDTPCMAGRFEPSLTRSKEFLHHVCTRLLRQTLLQTHCKSLTATSSAAAKLQSLLPKQYHNDSVILSLATLYHGKKNCLRLVAAPHTSNPPQNMGRTNAPCQNIPSFSQYSGINIFEMPCSPNL
jgi:hypothetical protein